MKGIIKASAFYGEVEKARQKGQDPGHKIGLPSLDELYRVKSGMMTIVTGIPGHGKSEIVDDMLVRLSRLYGWRFCFFSPENYPLEQHYIKIAEKLAGEQFSKFEASDHRVAHEWIQDHFTWLYPEDDGETVNLDWILDRARFLSESEGLHGLVLDPWNEIEHQRGTMSETDYVSLALTKIRRFARRYDVHCWIVAHPTKLQKDKTTGQYPVPTPYDISGSAHWRNKADFCLTVHRPDVTKNLVNFFVQKVKFKHLGRVGQCTLNYRWHCGTFEELQP